jgi:dTDP-4-amino-4,6-dideoxygalactose transaminase
MKLGRVLPPAAAPIRAQDIAAGIAGLLRADRELQRFRNELRQAFDVKYCFLVSSGKTALYCILKALHGLHPDRDEVLIPAFNCYCVASAIVRAGLKVRLCDVDADTLEFGLPALKTELDNRKRLLCVVPPHLFGLHAKVQRVASLVHDPSIPVVEDAAQVMGCSENGKKLGLQGEVGFFSLGRGKAFSTCEGGIIMTNDDAIGKGIGGIVETLQKYTVPELAMLLFKACVIAVFSHPSLFWIPKSLPFLGLGGTYFDSHFPLRSLSGFQAGMSRGWENRLEYYRTRRNDNSSKWVSFFNETRLAQCFSFANNTKSAHDLLRFPVRMATAELCAKTIGESDRAGLGITITYPLPLHELPELAGLVAGDFPVAKECAVRILTLPVHPLVTGRDMEKIGQLLQRMGA